ncbi:MAG: EAL domain-containing protein [Thiomonas sp.]|nr:EAL domain-containing protein [Thiomonas sp.]
MKPSLRRAFLQSLLWLPVALSVIWFVNQERLDYLHAQERVRERARHAALAEGQLIQLRLMQQFQQLGFVANAIVGDQNPETLDDRTRQTLQRYASEHPELLAINILSADTQRIAWSNHPQSAKPIFHAMDFTPMPGRPSDQLGKARFAPRYQSVIVAMRYRMQDMQGRTLYYVGSPYRLDALLTGLSGGGWIMALRDRRENTLLDLPRPGGNAAQPQGSTDRIEEPIGYLPMSLVVTWPTAKAWALYSEGLGERLLGRSLVVGLFVLAALVIGRLLRSRQTLLQKNARFARFNALLAHVNQAIVQSSDVADLLQRTCRLFVRDPGIALAWIGRPDEQARFVFLAHAGNGSGFLKDLVITADPDHPEQWCSAGLAWNEGRPVFASGSQFTAMPVAWRERMQAHGLCAAAALPLYRGKRLWALLHLYFRGTKIITPDLQRTLLDLAEDLSNGIDRLDILQSQALLQRQHASLLGNAVAGVVMVRYPGAIIVEANAAIARIFGVNDVQEVLGRRMAEVAPSLIEPRMIETTHTALKAGRVDLDALDIVRVDGRAACIAISGKRIEADAADSTLVVWTVVDVTERQRLMQQMERLSRADPLTGLPNRRALEHHLDRAISRAQQEGSLVAVGLLDLDDFKPVNDRYGHEVGDQLLKQLGERLLARASGSDMIARLGGDEFVVVIEDLDVDHIQAQLDVILTRLRRGLEQPFDLGEGRTATVGMSMGVALAPTDGNNADTLLRLADAAMYRVKARKITRTQWWHLAGSEPLENEVDPPFDPFGSDAQMLLGRIRNVFETVEREFVEAFYGELGHRDDTAAILAVLGPDGIAALKTKQAEHLAFLLDVATTAPQIQVRGRHLGDLHALVGVAPSWLSASMQLYRDLLHWHLDVSDMPARERYRLQRVFDARIQIDLQSQLDAMLVVQNTYNAYLARPLPRPGQSWIEVIDDKLQSLGRLPGMRGCALLRPGGSGLFVVQASGGQLAEPITRLLSTPDFQPSLDINSPTGHGLAAQAWRTESIVTAKAVEHCQGLEPWIAAAARSGVRSMGAIPLQRAGQTDSIMLVFGAYPNQFDTQQGRTFLTAVQNRWNLIDDLLRKRQQVIGQQDAAHFRQWLYAGGLRMFMQPVVELHSGRLNKVEALARLVSPEGKIIGPGQFLPALREADLDALFRMGLSQSLAQLAQWRASGLEIDLSINLPPSTLLHEDCVQWIQQALRDNDLAPRHLVLELLESQEVDESLRDEAIGKLGRLGVRLAIDDLGSGFSSLKRLASLPFDVIKVDQGIMLDIERDPVKALSLVRTVVQIGRDFEKEVVVEGVENAGIVEAVTQLGAQFGQGYGIAKPMPSEEFQSWATLRGAGRESSPQTASPRLSTPLGALAYHWLQTHDDPPHRATVFAQCPLSAYLQGLGPIAAEARALHDAVHHAETLAQQKTASKALTAWLAERVRRQRLP